MDNQRSERPERRMVLVARELKWYNVDIAALSKTRLPAEGHCIEFGVGYTFFWKGNPSDGKSIHGVGFAIKSVLVSNLNLIPIGINECLMTLCMPLQGRNHATILSAYTPTLDADTAVKDIFYKTLRQTLLSIPKDDNIFLLGDFNARVGWDHFIWKRVIGKNGVGNMNTNGLLVLGLCTEMNLIITNTIFRMKNKFQTSWMHPCSRHWYLLDYVITKQQDIVDVHITRAMRGADNC